MKQTWDENCFKIILNLFTNMTQIFDYIPKNSMMNISVEVSHQESYERLWNVRKMLRYPFSGKWGIIIRVVWFDRPMNLGLSWTRLFYNSKLYGAEIMQITFVHRNANKFCLVEIQIDFCLIEKYCVPLYRILTSFLTISKFILTVLIACKYVCSSDLSLN